MSIFLKLNVDSDQKSLKDLFCSFCKKNQFKWEKIDVESNASGLKLGLKQMVNEMINNKSLFLPDIKEVIELSKVTDKIFGY